MTPSFLNSHSAVWRAALCLALLAGCAESKCPGNAVERDGVCVVTDGNSLTLDGGAGEADGNTPDDAVDASDTLAADGGMGMAMDAAHDDKDSAAPDEIIPDAGEADSSAGDMDAAMVETTDASVETDAATEDVDSSVVAEMDAAVADPCEDAACSPSATCAVEGDQAVCTCITGYVGNGLVCARDYCVQLDGAPACGPNTECESTGGASVACSCAAGYGDCAGALGCETTLASNASHCGACGYECAGDGELACEGGFCEQAAVGIEAGHEVSCALLPRASTDPEGHKVKCWGRNQVGGSDNDLRLLGDKDFSGNNHPLPRDVTGLYARQIVAGIYHSCAIAGDTDDVYCWGDNAHFQLGTEGTVNPGARQPVSIPGVSKISVGRTHTCAVALGKVKCWGANDRGQLGLGYADDDRSKPVAALGISGTAIDVATSTHQTCALTAEGAVYCWPYSDLSTRRIRDQATGGELVGAVQLSMETDPSAPYEDFMGCALLSDGAVACWGSKTASIPGYDINLSTPYWARRLEAPAGVVKVAVGALHISVLTSAGRVYSVGTNAGVTGALGLPKPVTPYTAFTLVPYFEDAVDLAAGSFHTCIRRATGQVQCFGRNEEGELGNGNYDLSYKPQNVAGLP
jgi:Regulator of chromosome condensation (RCC1) repeat